MQKHALITGLTGQDGSYLAELLLNKNYKVFGLVRRSSNDPFVRISSAVKDQITLLYGNLRDSGSLERAIETAKPDEIFNLAAQSDVGISFACPEETFEINYYGLGRLINAAQLHAPTARIYQASTSEMFGSTPPPQNELSPMSPVSPYGQAKLKAHQDYVVGYREKHGMHISSGILFNHESPRRGAHFVTRKITRSLTKIKRGEQTSFELGNLDARRDWGFAGDYVDAMWRILQQPKADDYVIATGQMHTVREFLSEAARVAGLPLSFQGTGLDEIAHDDAGRVIVRINPKFYRPVEVHALQGDAAKAERILGWSPTTTFAQLVDMMMRADLDQY